MSSIKTKLILGVPPIVIFTITIILIHLSAQFSDGKDYKMVKEFLDFTTKSEYPDCTSLDLFTGSGDLQVSLSRNNQFTASHATQTNSSSQILEQNISAQINIERIHIAKLIEDVMSRPGTYFNCDLNQNGDREDVDFFLYSIKFSINTLELRYLNNLGDLVEVNFNLDANNEIHLDTMYVQLGELQTNITISDVDSKVIILDEETTLSLDQLSKGVLTSSNSELTKSLANMVSEVETYKNMKDIFNRLGEQGELAENISGVLKSSLPVSIK